jgi:hypothetical protein
MDKLEEIGLLCLIGILAVWGRLLLTLEKVTVIHFIRVSVTGGFVGLLLGVGFMDDVNFAPWFKYLVFGIAVSLAEDLMAGIFNVGRQWRDDPQSFIRLFRRK